jgi:hypothetical protein
MGARSAAKTHNNLLQELTATRKIGLRQLLSDNGEKFEKGRAFYQLTKPEIIQAQAFQLPKREFLHSLTLPQSCSLGTFCELSRIPWDQDLGAFGKIKALSIAD